MKGLHLKVRKGRGEEIRQKLVGCGLLDSERKIQSDDDFIYLPILGATDILGTELIELEEKTKKLKPSSLQDSLEGRLSPEELEAVPRAFDLIGDIAVLEIPDELAGKEKLIGEALLSTFKQIKVVARKESSVGTEFRTRKIRILAGENRKETVHKEYGCLYRLDVESSYFSPRLGTERMRVASQVKKGERVLVLFAGVGPYAILIAKKARPSKVVAVELNPEAVEYMRENVKLNKADVEVVLGDARLEAGRYGVFDRVVMPLPKDAGDFLDAALPALKSGGIVHFYDFSSGEDESIEKVRSLCKQLGYEVEVLDAVKCGSYSPEIFRVCVDFRRL